MNTQQTQYGVVTDLAALESFLAGATLVSLRYSYGAQKKWIDDLKAALTPHRGEIVGGSVSTTDKKNGNSTIDMPFCHHDPDGTISTEANAAAEAVLVL